MRSGAVLRGGAGRAAFYVWQNSIPPTLPPVTHINIIENWVGQLAQKAPARK